MRRSLLLMMAMLIVAATSFADRRHGSSLNISFDDDDNAADCGDLSVKFDGERVPVVAEQIPFHGSALRVHAEENGGGIRVSGTAGHTYIVTLCKAVAPGLDASAVRAVLAGNEVSAAGPSGKRWVGYFLIQAPRGAALDLRATNGPIAVDKFDGTLKAQAINGPVRLKESSGTIEASTKNGPVSLSGGSGNVKLRATNGPVSVKLDGATWEGTLDAATSNGPASLKLPRGFRSGVLIESLGSGPVTCRAEGCAGQRMGSSSGDHPPRSIEFGTGPRVVRLSTVNGPVSVRDGDGRRQ